MTISASRAQQIQSFNHELTQLEDEGVLQLSEMQKHALADYQQTLGFTQAQTSHQLGIGARLSALFATLALSSAIYFFLEQFWWQFPLSGQITLLIAAPLCFLFIAQFAHTRDHSGYFSRLFAVLSWVCFVLNISLLADLFNLQPSSNALLIWGIYATLLAFLYQSKLLAALGALNIIVFLAGFFYNGYFSPPFLEKNLEWYFIPCGLVFLLGLRPTLFANTYRGVGLACGFITLLMLCWDNNSSLLPWPNNVIENSYYALGLLFSSLAIGLAVRRSWQECYIIGCSFFVLFLYSKVFTWGWDTIPHYLFFLLIGAIALLCLLVFKRLQQQREKLSYEK